MRKSLNYGLAVCALVAAGVLGTSDANATLVDQGITYTLTEATTANPLVNEFTFGISGINGAADTEGGRSGVNAIAFETPPNFSSAAMITPPTGYDFVTGGLNSSGCDGHGGFFCFDANPAPAVPGTPYAADSSLTFVFDVTTSAAGGFAGYNPDMKIDWVGSQNNYDLVSMQVGITPPGPPPPIDVPAPGNALGLLGIGMIGTAGAIRWNRRRQSSQFAV